MVSLALQLGNNLRRMTPGYHGGHHGNEAI